jgi:hypothetical protein
MFAMTSAGGTGFIQDGCFFMTGDIFISHINCLPILSLGSGTHYYLCFGIQCSVTPIYESTVLFKTPLG